MLLDLDRPVTGICHGVEQTGQVRRSFNTRMEQIYRGRSDPSKFYTASMIYDVPAQE